MYYMTQTQYAKRMGVSYQTVRRWIKSGRVKAVIIKGKVRVPSTELETEKMISNNFDNETKE